MHCSLFRVICLFLACLFIGSATLSGDGMKIPAEGVRAYPDIPFQEAFIAHRDGVETLIIQSSIDGEGESFGWVVPVPAAPTNFEAVSPGVFDVLGQAVAPKIEVSADAWPLWLAGGVLFVIGMSLLLGEKSLLNVLVFIILILLVTAMTIPAFTKVRSAGKSVAVGVTIENQMVVGNYDVVVLSGESAAPLNAWLQENGFQSLPAEADEIVDEYLGKGWRFVATRLRRGGSDGNVLSPHPLRMDFPAKQPVYPMRLTALNAGPEGMRLELFIAAGGTPVAPQSMTIEESSRLQMSERSVSLANQVVPVFETSRGQTLAMDHLMPLLWDDAQLSRLSGRFFKRDMMEDILLDIGERETRRARYYSQRAANQWGSGLGSLNGGAVFLLIIWGAKREKKHGKLATFIVSAVAAGGAVLAVMIIVGAILPVVKTNYQPPLKLWANDLRMGLSIAQQYVIEQPAERLTDYLQAGYWGEPPIEEASPGDYVLLDDEGETVIRFFDYDGAPIDIRASDFAE